jgi:hypothetical protein
LTDGRVSKTVTITVTERISSTMTEKMKGHTTREGKEYQDKPLMMNRLRIIAKEYEELDGLSRRGIGMIKGCRKEKSKALL